MADLIKEMFVFVNRTCPLLAIRMIPGLTGTGEAHPPFIDTLYDLSGICKLTNHKSSDI